MALSTDRLPEVGTAYARLEEKILERDQGAASDIFYDLVRAGVPIPQLVGQLVRIHAPYTHVPYHQRLDDGIVRFVNNDHCLLSSRAGIDLVPLMPPELRYLPFAQTIWYMPTGLDPWNQLIGKMPGHYVRLYEIKFEGKPPLPEVHWPDQAPLAIEGTWPEKLNTWLTLVQRGEVINAYRVFLGLWDEAAVDPAKRTPLLAQLVFAGLIDVQDRVLYNRSYTTGHKSYRARATVELARAVGWDDAHSILYAGVPDIAVGPRWYSTYEMACQVVQIFLDNRDRELLDNDGALTPVESLALQQALLSGQEPGYIDLIVALLQSGRGLRQIIDTIQLASAQLIMETGDPNAYSMPQHSYEYCNTVRWFFDSFDASAPAQAAVRGRVLRQPRGPSPEAHPGQPPGEGDPAQGLGCAHPRAAPRAAGWCARRPPRVRGDGLDGGLPALRRGPRRARADAGGRRGQGGQRPAQPGAGDLPARRLRPLHRGRPRPPAARLGQAHRRAPQVRQSPRRVAALRGRLRARPLLTAAALAG